MSFHDLHHQDLPFVLPNAWDVNRLDRLQRGAVRRRCGGSSRSRRAAAATFHAIRRSAITTGRVRGTREAM